MSTAHPWGNLAPSDHHLPTPTTAVPDPFGTGVWDTPGVAKAQEWVAVREIQSRVVGEDNCGTENGVMAGCELRKIGLRITKF